CAVHLGFAVAAVGAIGKTDDVRRLGVAVMAIAVILLVLAPLRLNGYFINLIYITMVYVGLAYGWNVISGYAGYFSFGQITFFGLGAYTTALIASHTSLDWRIAALAGG